MTPATEVASMPLQAGVDIYDTSSPAAQTFKSCIDEVSRQDGFQSVTYGMGVESANQLTLLIDWDSVDKHKAFMAAPEYGPFLERFKSILDPSGGPKLCHVYLNGIKNVVTGAPVTEMITFQLPSSIGNEEYEKKFATFMHVAEGKAAGLKGWVSGWAEEPGEVEGKETKAYMAMLGWESVDAHMKYRETKEFKDSIGGAREPVLKGEMNHTKFSI